MVAARIIRATRPLDRIWNADTDLPRWRRAGLLPDAFGGVELPRLEEESEKQPPSSAGRETCALKELPERNRSLVASRRRALTRGVSIRSCNFEGIRGKASPKFPGRLTRVRNFTFTIEAREAYGAVVWPCLQTTVVAFARNFC